MTFNPIGLRASLAFSNSQSLAENPPTKTTCCGNIGIIEYKWWRGHTEIPLCADFRCSTTALTIHLTEGSKNAATSDLGLPQNEPLTYTGVCIHNPPFQLQLTKPNADRLVVISGRAELDVLRFFHISEAQLCRFVEALDNVIEVFVEYRFSKALCRGYWLTTMWIWRNMTYLRGKGGREC